MLCLRRTGPALRGSSALVDVPLLFLSLLLLLYRTPQSAYICVLFLVHSFWNMVAVLLVRVFTRPPFRAAEMLCGSGPAWIPPQVFKRKKNMKLEGGGRAEPWVLLLLLQGKAKGWRYCWPWASFLLEPRTPIPLPSSYIGLPDVDREVVAQSLHQIQSSSAKSALRNRFLPKIWFGN